jgi:hypothetical protein
MLEDHVRARFLQQAPAQEDKERGFHSGRGLLAMRRLLMLIPSHRFPEAQTREGSAGPARASQDPTGGAFWECTIRRFRNEPSTSTCSSDLHSW